MSEGLEQGAVRIVRRLTEAGYEAYMVGGCVRDKLLGRPVKDYDIATSARPEQVQDLFERTVPTGLQHGTVTVLLGGASYEVTTFRAEAEYEDFRRPTEVAYVDSLEEDLKRRDFTMNAMAIDAEGRLVDLFGGQRDLEKRQLRCVGKPEERFGEDALRMLRALRFASEYGLTMEAETWNGLLRSVSLLKHIAMERVRAELARMIEGRDPDEALRLLSLSKALRFTKEELAVAEADAVGGWRELRRLEDAEARWAYLYLRIGLSSAGTADDLRRLTCSRAFIDGVSRIVAAHEAMRAAEQPDSADEAAQPEALRRSWLRAALRFGRQTMRRLHGIYALDAACLAAAFGPHAGPLGASLLLHGEAWLKEMPVSGMAELAVTGEDLLALPGMKPGPALGRLLGELLDKAALGDAPNEREPLLDEARRVLASMSNRENETT